MPDPPVRRRKPCLLLAQVGHDLLDIRNLVEVLAQENAGLTSKVEHLSRRTVREKVLSYLSTEAHKQGSDRVVIPFNRQQMADYLSVERSGLSVVLGKLRDEGLIEYHKSTFRLLK